MNVRELVESFDLEVAAGAHGLDREVMGGWCGDLLSEVMANAPLGCVWLTVQGHQNIVAVAVLREMAAVVVTGGRLPDAETLTKADREGIPIARARQSAFELAGRLYASGVGDGPQE